MNNILLLLFSFLCMTSISASARPSPSILGITTNITRNELGRLSDSIVSIFGGEIITDSNSVIIHAGTKPFTGKTISVKSFKCLFNRKNTVQAVNVTIKAGNIDELNKAINEIENIFGAADVKQGEIGYSSELEWTKNKQIKAFFFSSIEQSEGYFLFATPSFMKEENERSKFAK